MKKLLREPLVHFLLLGAGLFVAFGLVGERTRSEPGEIVNESISGNMMPFERLPLCAIARMLPPVLSS